MEGPRERTSRGRLSGRSEVWVEGGKEVRAGHEVSRSGPRCQGPTLTLGGHGASKAQDSKPASLSNRFLLNNTGRQACSPVTPWPA
jgi:hypothetical protein